MKRQRDCNAPLVVLVAMLVLVAATTLIGGFDWLFPNSESWSEFVRNIIIAVASVTLGIPAGLELNRRWQHSQDYEKRKQLLATLRRVFISNISYLQHAAKVINSGLHTTPSFPLDLVPLEATTGIQYQLIDDVNLLRSIEIAYIELIHASRRMEFLSATVLSQSPTFQSTIADTETLLEELRSHIETKGLADAVSQHVGGDKPTSALSLRQIAICNLKLETLRLILGLTSDVNSDRYIGTVKHCQYAIDDINRAIGKESNTP